MSSKLQGERSTGVYAWLSQPWIYDAWQTLVRSYASRAAFFQRHIRPIPGMRVLDVGCGTGDALKHLGNVNYLGLDRNEAYIKAAQKRFNRPDCFLHGDVSTISERDLGEFDVVFCLGVLHHLNDATAVCLLREIQGILAPGGRFVSHDPVLVEGQSKIARWFVSHDRGQFVRTHSEIEALAKTCFPTVYSVIDSQSLRIPFTEVILECGGLPGNGDRQSTPDPNSLPEFSRACSL